MSWAQKPVACFVCGFIIRKQSYVVKDGHVMHIECIEKYNKQESKV